MATLDDRQMGEFLGLIDRSDTVELKLTIPEDQRRSTIAAMDMDPLDSYLRQIYFFDTRDLKLDRAGVVVRARRSQGRPNDSVVKLRPVDPDDLDADLRAAEGFGVEVDAMPGGYVCSASFKGGVKGDRVRDVSEGRRGIEKLFSKGQRSFYAQHAPDGLDLDELDVLGPINVLKLKWEPEGYDRKLVAELWFYPDGSRILELSTKCRPEETFDVAARTRAYLNERGIDLGGEQQTKTRTALEFFAGDG